MSQKYSPSLPRRETLFLCRIESSLFRECRMRSRMEWRWDISSFYVRCSHIAGWADKKNVVYYFTAMRCALIPTLNIYRLITLKWWTLQLTVCITFEYLYIRCKIFIKYWYTTRIYFALANLVLIKFLHKLYINPLKIISFAFQNHLTRLFNNAS